MKQIKSIFALKGQLNYFKLGFQPEKHIVQRFYPRRCRWAKLDWAFSPKIRIKMKTIHLTAAYDTKTKDKVAIYSKLNNKLEKIDISKLTDKFNLLGIIFQCFEPQKGIKVETFKKMRRKTKTLELYLVLDYDRILQGSDEENLVHIKEVFISGCETFLKDIKGFDWLAAREAILKVIDS